MPGLTITPPPFRSSFLSIPPSPHSPLSPLTTTFSRPISQPTKNIASVAPANKHDSTTTDNPAPAKPLPWLWQCHICQRSYPLGATRRCLDDGHYFCSGQAQSCTLTRRGLVKSKQNKKKNRGRSCNSEFDYLGWQIYGDWRRQELSLRAQATGNNLVQAEGRFRIANKKDCSANCNYPSECRWGKANNDFHLVEAVVAQPIPTTIIEHNTSTIPVSFEEILGLTPPDLIADDDIMEDVELTSPLSPPSPQQQDVSFWSGLINTAKLRKNNTSEASESLLGSPLATIFEDDAVLVPASEVVIINHELNSVQDAVVPIETAIRSSFDITPPAKRTGTDGLPLVPSPLRMSRTPSSSSLDQQSQLGLGISMDDSSHSSK